MFKGNILFLDRDDINTDEIIPAKYLNETAKIDLKAHLFEDLSLEGFSTDMIPDVQVVVSRANFGCGSSREHAPWALQVNDIRMVIASGFARIFRQNMYNCGLLPVELQADAIADIFDTFSSAQATCEADLDAGTLTVRAEAGEKSYSFDLSDFHRDLIKAGGWVEYANAKY